MFIRERLIMILVYTQNHSPSIHGDGWYVNVLFIHSLPALFMKNFQMTELPMTAKQDKSLESQNFFFIFGGGSRQCPGKELGIAEISTFLHYFVTRYR